ncbi:hypothetical protein F5879DRAFT_1009968 [Lentinula edodes]|nr:hypothetical protein HHX47_DHR1001169 [Lentinula edodes]KAJ3904364.1 hypothetical protein F5879DRAFT_1009968 [Lentinula edodes]KAJ3923307.1 hypothetical protein F5877DRAFT_87635 [Lentinula edodes]
MSITVISCARDGEHSAEGLETRESQANLKAAVARTVTRGIALYFSRPVRLFRPSKVSGWHSLRGLASHEGSALTPGFIKSLVKDQGLMVIPRHFVPPMLVNALLGTVLWTTYTEASKVMEPHISRHPTMTAALCGAIAGGFQAIVAAPAENVRLLFEGGSVYHSWSHAWKDVFRGTEFRGLGSRQKKIEDARQVRRWMKEVGDMAGRGWNGWIWGCAKDTTGFAVFFSIFEVTRRIAFRTREDTAILIRETFSNDEFVVHHIPKMIHSFALVSGGVLAGLAYEFTGRPWDHARRIVHLQKLQNPTEYAPWWAIFRQFRQEGLSGFFANPALAHAPNPDPSIGSGYRPKLTVALRTLGRVGPWGIGFLIYESFGPGLQSN